MMKLIDFYQYPFNLVCRHLKSYFFYQEENVCSEVTAVLKEEKLDALLCFAGGWAGGSPSSKDFIKNAEIMWRSSVWPSSISARLACEHLREGGVVVLPGAQPATTGTPTMAGYGMAKVC